MKEQDNETFSIHFSGDILPGYEVENVKEQIAQLFHVHRDEVTPLFEGEAIFKRLGLNQLTAIQYYHKFHKIGALCLLEPEGLPTKKLIANEIVINSSNQNRQLAKEATPHHSVENSQVSIDNSMCPKCNSTNINDEECLNCGVIFAKLRKLTSTTPDSTAADLGDEPGDTDSLWHLEKATKIIKYVAIYFLAVFSVDNFLLDHKESLQYVIDPGLGLSIIPYLLGHIGLAWGCYYLSLGKGRSGLWCTLGFASLPGLGLLLLLPNRNSVDSSIKNKLFALSVIFLSIYWLAGYLIMSSARDQLIEQSIGLRQERHEFPSANLDVNAELFEGELDELEMFLDEGFEFLSRKQFQSKNVSIISEAMFSETVRLFIWINYQQYLQNRNGESGIEFLQHKNVTQLKKEIIAKIMKKVVEADHFDLSQKYEEWFVGTDREAYDFLDVFSNSLYEMDMKHREFILLNNEWGSTSEFSFDSFDLSLFKNVKVSTTDDIMMFDFSEYNFPAADKTLAMANYFRPYKRYSLTEMKQVTSYSLVQVQISPDFPNKYLSRNYSPFSSIDCFIIKRR